MCLYYCWSSWSCSYFLRTWFHHLWISDWLCFTFDKKQSGSLLVHCFLRFKLGWSFPLRLSLPEKLSFTWGQELWSHCSCMKLLCSLIAGALIICLILTGELPWLNTLRGKPTIDCWMEWDFRLSGHCCCHSDAMGQSLISFIQCREADRAWFGANHRYE